MICIFFFGYSAACFALASRTQQFSQSSSSASNAQFWQFTSVSFSNHYKHANEANIQFWRKRSSFGNAVVCFAYYNVMRHRFFHNSVYQFPVNSFRRFLEEKIKIQLKTGHASHARLMMKLRRWTELLQHPIKVNTIWHAQQILIPRGEQRMDQEKDHNLSVRVSLPPIRQLQAVGHLLLMRLMNKIFHLYDHLEMRLMMIVVLLAAAPVALYQVVALKRTYNYFQGSFCLSFRKKEQVFWILSWHLKFLASVWLRLELSFPHIKSNLLIYCYI